MKALAAASIVLGSALALVGCGPDRDGRDGMGGGPDAGMNGGGGDGGGTGEMRRCNKMDIVFVVDDSGSMAEEQGNLATNFPMFASVLENYVNADGEHIDFRVAVTTTGKDISYTVQGSPFPFTERGDNGEFRNNCGVNKRWLDPSDGNLGQLLGCRASVGTSGPGIEMPLIVTKMALDDRMLDGTNTGFLRPDALLGIVILTDEDDSSSTHSSFTITVTNPDPPIDYHPADLIAFLDGLKGHRSRWAAGVIAGETACTSAFGDAVAATRLKDFVTQAGTQAVFSSICAGNLTTALSEIIAKFQAACGQIIL
jgi:hypothetical protein